MHSFPSESEVSTVVAPAEATDPLMAGQPSVLREFEDRVRERPQAPAVLTATDSLSYAELEAAADAIAERLSAAGATPGRIVAVLSDLSGTLVAAELAVLKLGCAFLPILPTDPLTRTRAVLAEANVAAVVADRDLDLPGVLVPDLAQRSANRYTDDPHPEQIAYIIYTSGSTGRPKGVQIPHRGLANVVAWSAREWQLGPDDRTALFVSPAFDVSVLEIWRTLTTGGVLVVPGPDDRGSLTAVRDWLERRAITHCDLPMAMAEGVLDLDWPAGTRLRVLRTGGDRLTRFRPPGLPFPFVNEYGPTECSVTATFTRVPEADDGAGVPSIGSAVDGTEVLVLDENLEPVAEGEIYLGGAGLARGYLDRPGLTAQRFVPDPRGGGARLYRTGDQAVVRADGNLDFRGRRDNQVKIRGFRIELGEIETVLNGHPQVRKAAVLARQDQPGEKELVAYVALDPGAEPDLAAHLRGTLPDYMVPARFVVMDELPATVNGKVDRAALPVPPRTGATDTTDNTAARTPTEHALVRLWCKELGLDTLGVHEDFVALGGQSLMALRIATRIEQELGKPVRAHHIFGNPTVAALADVVDELPRTVAVAGGAAAEPVVSSAQQRLWFTEQLHPGTSLNTEALVVGLAGPLDRAALAAAVREVVRRHVPLRTGYVARDGSPVLSVLDDVTPDLPEHDLRDRPPAARDELTRAFATTVFDLDRPPLIKFALLRLAEHRHELLFAVHHIAFDGWSARLLVHELGELYRAFVAGLPSPLPPITVSYQDVARRQHAKLAGGGLADGFAYWRQVLDPPPAPLSLPVDRPRPAELTNHGARLGHPIPAELWAAVERLGRERGATNFMVLFAVFLAVLRRYTGQDDLVTATVAAGREDPDSAHLLGFFINTLPIRADLSGDPTFEELLDRVRGVLLAATRHSEVPLERIIEHVGADRDLSRHPLFQTMFVLQDTVSPVAAGELTVSLGQEFDNGMAKLDFLINIDFPYGRPMLGAEYATQLFDAATVERILGHYEAALHAVTANPGVRVTELPLGHGVLGSTAPHLVEDLRTLVARQAVRAPDVVAIEGDGVALTYAQLGARRDLVTDLLGVDLADTKASVASVRHADDRLGVPARVLSYDVAMPEILGTLAVGGTVVLADEQVRRDPVALLDFLRTARIERLFLPVPALAELAATVERTGKVPTDLRDVITTGGPVRVDDALAALFHALPKARLHHHYGTADLHVAIAHTMPEDPADWPWTAPIGTPVTGVLAQVFDADGVVVPVGVVGELHVGTPRFSGTGDLARCDADGVLWLVDRADDVDDDEAQAPVEEPTAAAPGSALAAVVVAVFAEALDRDTVGRDDGFFDLGGHSLVATKLVAMLGEALGVKVPVRALFTHHTPGELTEWLLDQYGDTVEAAASALVGASTEDVR